MKKAWADQFLQGCKVLQGAVGEGVGARVRRAIFRLRLRWMMRGIGSVTTVHSDGRVQTIRKLWPLGRFRETK